MWWIAITLFAVVWTILALWGIEKFYYKTWFPLEGANILLGSVFVVWVPVAICYVVEVYGLLIG